MRPCHLPLLFLAAGRVLAQAPTLSVTRVDIHERLYPDRAPVAAPDTPIHVPRNGTAAFQFVVTSDRDATARVSASGMDGIRIYRLQAVHVEGNTQGSLKNRPGGEVPEGWLRQLVRAAPFATLEVLVEDDELPLEAGQTAGVVVEVPVPADATTGEVTSTVSVSAQGATAEVTFRLQVHATTLPDELPLHSVHWLWPEPFNLTSGDVPEWWSERHWTLLEHSAVELRHFGDDTVYTPLINYREPLIQTARHRDGGYTFDFSRFDRWATMVFGLGFRYLAGHHILGLATGSAGGVWVHDEAMGKLDQPFKEREAWLEFLPTFYDALSSHLAEKGWTNRYVQHQYDEPKDAELYERLAKLAREHLPGVRTIDAINSSRQDLFSPLVDLQVFNLLGLGRFQDVARARRAEGRGVWLYHCTSPYPPYPNRHLDNALTESRLYPWLCYQLGADGFLYWGANIYRGANEYTSSIGPFPNGSQDPGHPPGDNWFYYRGPDGLRPSMRIASFREGLVDNALLTLLAAKDRGTADEVANGIARSLTDYERDPAVYHAARTKLLELLDAETDR